jgi:gamma-tubulin complex component 3
MCYLSFSRLCIEMADMIHMCFAMANEMTKFVQSVNYYIMFEVLECSWSDLLSKLMEAKDLEQILEAHDDSLLKILIRLHLDGHETSQDLAKQLRCIFDLILNFGSIIQRLIQTVETELQERKPYQQQQNGTYNKNIEPVRENESFDWFHFVLTGFVRLGC